MPNRAIQADPRSMYVRRLNLAYRKGLLNVFVGAGISQESNFPSWEAFIKELMRQYLALTFESKTPVAMLASTNIDSFAEEIFSALGREAAADFVYRASSKRFPSLLGDVLYDRRSIEDLPLKSVHRQIAALSDKARLYTLNFDPLLELAISRKFPDKEWLDFRSPLKNGEILRRKHKVEHLHGWIDPDGKTSSDLVFTESDYLELTKNSGAPANTFLEILLAKANTTLILGMSLADPNFRRVLYFLNQQQRSSRERIYAVMRQQKPALDHYVQEHWENRGLRLLFIETHDEIPGLLRDVQWGEAPPAGLPRWIKEAIFWRQRILPGDVIFSEPWQRIAYTSLSELSQQVRNLFEVPQHEKLHFSLFVPFWESPKSARLRMVASSRKDVGRKGAIVRARNRVLSIRKGQEQGIAGVCFSTGINRAVAYGEGRVDINFTAEMSKKWLSQEGYRDWRSIIAMPVIDTEDWIPVAVIALTSNFLTPFWKNFGAKQNLLEPELHTIMRRTVHFCLKGHLAP